MSRIQLAATLLIAGLLFSWGRPVQAQGYVPQRPVFSPYLNLYNRDSGILNNYFTYVRPRQQLQTALERQQANIQRQRASIQQHNQAIRGLQYQVSELNRRTGVRPTGTGSWFNNYSHYYQFPTVGGRRR